jgi:hypothetical protein
MSMADSAEYQLEMLGEAVKLRTKQQEKLISEHGFSDYATGYFAALEDIANDMGITL